MAAFSSICHAEGENLAGTDLTGKWDETILNASDVNAYQDASKILAFSVANGTKGSHV